jgi:hypothetical protein
MMKYVAELTVSFACLAALTLPGIAASCGDLTRFVPPSATITSATDETGSFESPADGLGNITR